MLVESWNFYFFSSISALRHSPGLSQLSELRNKKFLLWVGIGLRYISPYLHLSIVQKLPDHIPNHVQCRFEIILHQVSGIDNLQFWTSHSPQLTLIVSNKTYQDWFQSSFNAAERNTVLTKICRLHLLFSVVFLLQWPSPLELGVSSLDLAHVCQPKMCCHC